MGDVYSGLNYCVVKRDFFNVDVVVIDVVLGVIIVVVGDFLFVFVYEFGGG